MYKVRMFKTKIVAQRSAYGKIEVRNFNSLYEVGNYLRMLVIDPDKIIIERRNWKMVTIWELISRNHVTHFKGNTWSLLSKSIGKKISPISRHKAVFELSNQKQKKLINKKIKKHNDRFQTDFSMEWGKLRWQG